jgi:hypothetical protein
MVNPSRKRLLLGRAALLSVPFWSIIVLTEVFPGAWTRYVYWMLVPGDFMSFLICLAVRGNPDNDTIFGHLSSAISCLLYFSIAYFIVRIAAKRKVL